MEETLPAMFQRSVERRGTAPALRARKGSGWRTLTWAGYGRNVRDLALGLAELGVAKGDRVGIWGRNAPEWAVADFAALHLGAVPVPVYDTLAAAKAAEILADAGVRVLFVAGAREAEAVATVRHLLPALEHVVAFEPTPGTLPLAEVSARGQARDAEAPEAFDTAWRAVQAEDVATIVYTSGTTGVPKGVVLTHANIASNVRALLRHVEVEDDDRTFSFLPLSHSFERTVGHFAVAAAGATVCYASSLEAVAEEIAEVRPSLVTAVPRFYEKLHARILAQVEAASPLRRRIFAWALAVGLERAEREVDGRPSPPALRLQDAVADRLVFRKVRARMGGRLRFFVSGGASLSPEIERFLAAMRLRILQGYGLTETSPVVACNVPAARRFGTVGRALEGVEVRVADDGEVLVRGPNVMRGYFGRPEETAEVLTPDGWFRTGDVGRLDDDGFLTITDRKKDLLVLSNGKNVAPQPIENALKGRWIQQAVVLGTDRNHVAALLVPDFERLETTAAEAQWTSRDRADLLARPEVRAIFEAEVARVNATLARFEQVKRFALLPRELTLEEGETTPSLKVRRKVVAERYAKEIEALYAGAVAAEA